MDFTQHSSKISFVKTSFIWTKINGVLLILGKISLICFIYVTEAQHIHVHTYVL